MAGRAVHVNHEHFDEYVGRAMPRQGFMGSKWANPFKIDKPRGITAEHAVRQYAGYLAVQPDLLAALPELHGKVLGCWCITPKDPDAWCHARLLSELAELNATEVMLRLREVANGG